jgi:hypothetical protein
MPLKLTRRVYEIAALIVAALILVVMAWRLSHAHGLNVEGQPLFGDFIAFWSAGRLALEGHADLVHNVSALHAQHLVAVPGLPVVAPWNSPPTFLLISAGLALLPYPAAACVFLLISGALYFYAARKILPDTRALLFAATLPSAIYHLGSVQTGLLIAGVSALALYWLDRKPMRAGALVGLLAIKPHLAILWPLLLLLSGRWRAFAAASVATLSFALIAGLVFGFESYPRFLDNLARAQTLISEHRVPTETFASFYGNLLSMGASHSVALAVHALSALAAVAVAGWIFLRRDAREAQGATLCAATMLISPYLFFYDATLLAAGAALLGLPRDRYETFAFVVAWSAGLSVASGAIVALPLCPIAAWIVLIAAFRRARAAMNPTRTG